MTAKYSDALIRYDWSRAWAVGCQLALEQSRLGAEITKPSVMWALLCEAATTSALAYSAPPRSGMPSKSTMPDAVDDVTEWQKISAYLRGDLDDMPETESRPPMPSADQVTRAGVVLELWHKTGTRTDQRLRKAVYLKACGVADRKVRGITGYSRQFIHRAKTTAMSEMLDAISHG